MTRLGVTAVALAGLMAFTQPAAAAGRHAPSPKAGSRVVAARAGGKVTVKPRGAHKFRKLKRAAELKVGSTIDASKGTVRVTGKIGRAKVTARFSGAQFKITQSGRKGPLVATLTGGGIACKGNRGKAGARRSLRARGGAGIVVKGCFASSKVKPARGAVAAVAHSGDWTTTDTPGVTKVVNAGKSVALTITDSSGATKTLAPGAALTFGPGATGGGGGGGGGGGVTLPSTPDFAVYGLYDVKMDDVLVHGIQLLDSHFTLSLHAKDIQHPANGSAVAYPAHNDVYFPNARVLCWYDDGHGAYQYHKRDLELFGGTAEVDGAGFSGTNQQVHGNDTVTQTIQGAFSGSAATRSVHGSLGVHTVTTDVTHTVEGGGTVTDNEICDSTRDFHFEGFH